MSAHDLRLAARPCARRGALLVLALLPLDCGDVPTAVMAGPNETSDGGSETEAIVCSVYNSVAQVEMGILLPKCGRAGDGACHGGGNDLPRMVEVGAIAANVLEVPGVLNCHRDKIVSRAAPEKSYLLAKIRAKQSTVTCTDGTEGGSRMPYQDAPPLTAEEIACLRWWVYRIIE